jgi:PleD family two-component response regulator
MLNAATDEIERVRESIAATRFRRGDVTWDLTVSCALAKPAADESTGDLLKRLDEATLEAKRYGKNRTFLHEDGNPAPVVPPKIEVEPQVIELTEFESP